MIVGDTGAVYAIYDADDVHHLAVRNAIAGLREAVHIPTPCLGELDYMLRKRLGVAAELDFLGEVRTGRFILEPLKLADAARCSELIEQYESLDLGLADASVVAIAERLQTSRVLTVDYRDFQTLRMRDGKAFTIIPTQQSRKRLH
ncbi:MAG: PIN domain-containing protein [Candidatus Eremiobacteraeota bacterium]|nr:PIN domain-containing protein [Candidatus Eremiobacteraeota bacterium]